MKQLSEALHLNGLMQRVFRVDLNKISKESKEILMLVSQQIDEMRQPGFTPEQFGNNRLFIDK